MTDIAISVENLSKRYRIGARQKRANTLRETLGNLAASPFDYLRRTLRGPTEEEIIWALKDVSFEACPELNRRVKRGEVVGIPSAGSGQALGATGLRRELSRTAGKTTLLKVLSRITEPTEGRASINGRVGSLLEVGTGFHPELTGRENIYLNGAIPSTMLRAGLGMKRTEIDRKFDEIVAFAEIEKFIDTPVKRYSSGMYVRLAFAVAAHRSTWLTATPGAGDSVGGRGAGSGGCGVIFDCCTIELPYSRSCVLKRSCHQVRIGR
jgi:lipopolysaccharide transport system ATP-binding protein